jgi:thioesterase domain-containing protein
MLQELTTAALESYLHEHIPLSKAMQVEVVAVQSNAVVLRAPLAPNINHRETAFGGSASALAILSAWSLLHTRLRSEGIECQLVIQRNTMDYDLPIAGTFHATASLGDAEDWPRFIRMFERKGRSRITVTSVLQFEGALAGRFSGEFVAIGNGARRSS